MNIIKMWHGGRDLEYNYKEFKESRKKRWEYGTGLYLTDHYETARKYAKGGGKTYLVEFEAKGFIGNKYLELGNVLNFIKSYVVKSKVAIIMEDINFHLERMDDKNNIAAEIFLNLMINHDAVVGKNTKKLNEFMVNHGVDILFSDRFGGRDETIVCVFNNKNIKKVKAIYSKDVLMDEYNLNVLEKLRDFESQEKKELLLCSSVLEKDDNKKKSFGM